MELVTWVLALAIVVALVTRRFRHLNRLRHIPGPKAYQLIGNAMDLVVPANRLVEHIVHRYFMKYNQIFTLWMGPVPTVFVFQPHHVQTVFTDTDVFFTLAGVMRGLLSDVRFPLVVAPCSCLGKDVNDKTVEAILGNGKHLEKPFIYGFPKKWLGTGLLTSTGTKWQSRRKLIDPSFHLSLLENFLHVFCEKSPQLVRELQQHENSAQEFDAYSLVTKCTLDIICDTATGTQMKTNDKKGDLSYMEAVHESTVLLMERFLRPWLYPDFIYWNTIKGKRFLHCVKVIHSFTDKVLHERQLQKKHSQMRENKDAGRKKKMAFLDMMLEAGENGGILSDEDIREEVNTFMVTGHHTSTATICWVLQMLGCNRNIQDRMHEELDHIFQGSQRSPSMKDLNDMKYLERVIKETLRLYPVLPTIARTLSEDVQLDGYTLPAGLVVFLPSFLTHRLSQYFPDPDKFDPDRFLPENVANRHPYAYIPFSAGPRNCIGLKFALLEVKTVLSFLLRRFKVSAVTDKLTPIVEVTIKPAEGFKLTISGRDSGFHS